MLCPSAALGLQDAAVLAAAVAAAVPKASKGSSLVAASVPASAGGSGGSEELHRSVEKALKQFDRMRQPEVSSKGAERPLTLAMCVCALLCSVLG
jgi:hypothetical protein